VTDKLLKPRPDEAALVLRVGLAAIFIVHGYYKLVISDMLGMAFPDHERERLLIQQVVGCVEVFGGLMLLLGVFSRFAALAFVAVQAGAIYFLTWQNFLAIRIRREGADYMRVGPEYNLALIGMCVCVLMLGSGAWSVDRLLWTRWKGRKAQAVLAPPPVASPKEAIAAAHASPHD
jgi:putative oxidoreductase